MMKRSFIVFIVSIFATTFVSADALKLHPENPHYFQYHNKPMLIVSSGEHYGAVLNLDFDYDTYLDTMQRESMNYTRMFTGSYFEKAGAFGIQKNTLAPALGRELVPWARSTVPGYPDGGNKFDLNHWNKDYFSRLKDFVKKAQDRGIVVEVTLFTSIYNDDNWNLCPLNPANHINKTGPVTRLKINTLDNGGLIKYQKKMVRKIVRELNGFDNVLYEIQNEPYIDLGKKMEVPNPEEKDKTRKTQVATSESQAWQKAIASAIVNTEKKLPQKHLIAENYANAYCPIDEVNPAVSILNFHYALPIAVLDNYKFNRVIAFDESGFAGSSDDVYRKQAWNFILSGGGSFNNLDYSFTVEKEDGTDINKAPGGGSPVLRKQLKILHDFMNEFDYIHMTPKSFEVKHAKGTKARALASRNQIALYLGGGNQCEVVLDLDKGNYTATWLDPRTGKILKDESVAVNDGKTTLESPSYEQDIALKVLKNK